MPCGNCRYFKKSKSVEVSGGTLNRYVYTGDCRKYPPTFHEEYTYGVFPLVDENMWCGEQLPVIIDETEA